MLVMNAAARPHGYPVPGDLAVVVAGIPARTAGNICVIGREHRVQARRLEHLLGHIVDPRLARDARNQLGEDIVANIRVGVLLAW
jgi:hypothetical protein